MCESTGSRLCLSSVAHVTVGSGIVCGCVSKRMTGSSTHGRPASLYILLKLVLNHSLYYKIRYFYVDTIPFVSSVPNLILCFLNQIWI